MPFIESNINIQNVFTINEPAAALRGRGAARVPLGGHARLLRRDAHSAEGRPAARRTATGADGKRVAVITDALARQYWPEGDDPVGDTMQFRFSGTPTSVEVVGVVGSLRHDRLDRAARAELFMPLAQMPFGSMTFVVRSAGDASGLMEPARAAIWSVDPGQTIYRQRRSTSSSPRRSRRGASR